MYLPFKVDPSFDLEIDVPTSVPDSFHIKLDEKSRRVAYVMYSVLFILRLIYKNRLLKKIFNADRSLELLNGFFFVQIEKSSFGVFRFVFERKSAVSCLKDSRRCFWRFVTFFRAASFQEIWWVNPVIFTAILRQTSSKIRQFL